MTTVSLHIDTGNCTDDGLGNLRKIIDEREAVLVKSWKNSKGVQSGWVESNGEKHLCVWQSGYKPPFWESLKVVDDFQVGTIKYLRP